jgi:hypothetical protein
MDFINAIHHIDQLSRKTCRKEFEQRFSRECMVNNYEQLYYDLLPSHLFNNYSVSRYMSAV